MLVGVAFVLGSLLRIQELLVGSNFLLVPILLLYYRFRASWTFLPIVAALLILYIRDIFLVYGEGENYYIITGSFYLAISVLLLCVATSIRKSKIFPTEIISFFVMYGFLIYLFVALQDIIQDISSFNRISVSIYLLLLILLVAGSFTSYIMKSHLASLWFLIAASALLVSEISLLFKIFIVEDISVNFFFPFFHVIAYFAMVEYGMRRWKTGKLRYF